MSSMPVGGVRRPADQPLPRDGQLVPLDRQRMGDRFYLIETIDSSSGPSQRALESALEMLGDTS